MFECFSRLLTHILKRLILINLAFNKTFSGSLYVTKGYFK